MSKLPSARDFASPAPGLALAIRHSTERGGPSMDALRSRRGRSAVRRTVPSASGLVFALMVLIAALGCGGEATETVPRGAAEPREAPSSTSKAPTVVAAGTASGGGVSVSTAFSGAKTDAPEQLNPAPTAASDNLRQTTPADLAADHFAVERADQAELWSAATGKRVQSGPIAGEWLDSGRPVASVPGLFITAVEPRGGMSRLVWVDRVGAPRVPPNDAPTMEICSRSGSCEEQLITQPSATGPFVSGDLRRLVYLKNGDLWRAEIDWQAGEVVNHRQVTSAGVLHTDHEWPRPVLWYGNTLLMEGHLSKEKPILRIDLESGEIDELGRMNLFKKPLPFLSPSGSRACNGQEKVLTCFDLAASRLYEIPLPDARGRTFVGVGGGKRDSSGAAAGIEWIDDQTMVALYYTTGRNGESDYGLVRTDFERETAERILSGQTHVKELEVLPGTTHVAVVTGPDSDPRLVRVGIRDGTVVELPKTLELGGRWLDANRYLYGRKEGGVDAIGTWMYDVSTGTETKVCERPAHGDEVLYFPEPSRVYFQLARSQEIMGIDLAAAECRPLDTKGHLSKIASPTIDFDLSLSGDALWTASRVEQKPVMAAEELDLGVGDIRLLRETIEDDPPGLRQEVEEAYQHVVGNPFYNHYLDPYCIALAVRQWRLQNPDREWILSHVFSDLLKRGNIDSWRGCIDRDRVVATAAGAIGKHSRNPRLKGTLPEEFDTECAAGVAADRWMENPRFDMRYGPGNYVVAAAKQCAEEP